MSSVVLHCGDCPVPIALSDLETVHAAQVPTDAEFDDVTLKLDVADRPRLVVLGGDAALANVLGRLMKSGRLHIEIAYVPAYPGPAAKLYRTGTGAGAAARALEGHPTPLPLVRDELGHVLVGEAVITGVSNDPIEGEAYTDDTKLFSGHAKAIRVTPTADAPGVRASMVRPLFHRWISGRAFQLGTAGATVTRDGVADPRVLKRISFYRHNEDWLLVL
ncbi:hypothetical protein [Smaragdicoccus niigatensis]|uniref:hypothetical protein n=1 Tax=Smaragdicoccus niigatensis TaxID=359359 RepID=UPI0006891510|nr:hypothetical protein [Smaragdicoccus niigatensis]